MQLSLGLKLTLNDIPYDSTVSYPVAYEDADDDDEELEG